MAITLTVGGQVFTRWTSVRATRGLKRAVSDFTLEVPGELVPQILPFEPCSLADDADLLLTGYIVAVEPEIGARESRTQITGQSKTQDLVDCMPEFDTNEFSGSTLDAIARAVAAAFGVGVVVAPGVAVGDPFPIATYQRSETGFAFLERLARQRAVLLTDDANGNLVLATAGTARAPANLVMGKGGNIVHAQGSLNGKGRFSKYTILSQAGMSVTGSDVQCDIEAVASDGGVPRYRPLVIIGESALMSGDAQLRAKWEAAHRSGEAVQATLTVPGWRAHGALWQMNQIATCAVPRLALADDYLIGEIAYLYDDGGKRVEMKVAPPSAFTPEPPPPNPSAGGWTGLVPVP